MNLLFFIIIDFKEFKVTVPNEQNCQKYHASPSQFFNSYSQQETPFKSQENMKNTPKVNKFLSNEAIYNENMA